MAKMVRVEYRNKDMQVVAKKEYAFQDYVDVVRVELLKIITDVEDLVYATNGNKPKEEWDEAGMIIFNRIKHKLLDRAGEIQRLPSMMYDTVDQDKDEQQTLGFWKTIFGDGVHKV